MLKYLTKWWTVCITIAAFSAIQISNPDLVQSVKYSYYDYLQSKQETIQSSDIVLVNIDEKAIAQEGQYPWPRDIVAKYLDKAPADSLSVLNIICINFFSFI